MSTRTANGFRNGAAEVVSVAEVEGYAIIWVQTPHHRIEVIASPKGRRLTVKEGLKPVVAEPLPGTEVPRP